MHKVVGDLQKCKPVSLSRRRPPDAPVETGGSGDAYLPLKQLAAYSGLSLRTLRGHLSSRSHPLPYYRIGGKILVRRREYDAWVREFRIQGPTVNIDAVVEDVLKDLR